MPDLMPYQTKGVEFLSNRKGAALLMDRGTGKTATVLTDLERQLRAGNAKKALYVAPLSTLENVRREVARFTNGVIPMVVSGTRKQRVDCLARPAHIYIVNFEGVRILVDELRHMEFDYIVVDESTRMKDRRTQAARALNIIGINAKYKRILTGMPFTEGVENAWSQFHFINPSILDSNYYAFQNRYCVQRKDRNRKTGKQYSKVTGYRNLAQFENRIMPYVYRVDKHDVLDLPPRNREVLKVPMLLEQKKRYEHIQKAIFTEIAGEEITHAVALSKLAKLRQVAAGFLYDDEHNPVVIPCGKYQELQDVLGEILFDSRKIVIFTAFQAEPPMVMKSVESLDKKGVRAWLLPKKPTDRQRTIDEWESYKNGPGVLIANARSGGTGLNLNAADVAIFISNDWRMEDRVQAEDRIYRMGSEIFEKITLIDIVTEGTIDEDIIAALQTKKGLVDVFLDRMRDRQKKGDSK